MKKRVLLIDDDILTHSVMKNTLKVFEYSLDSGIQLDHASSLEEAEIKLKKKSYDLILLDYFIRERTSELFLIDIKEKYPDTRINIITSIRDYAILKKLLKSGASRVIYKPLSWKDIVRNIRENLFITNTKKEKQNEKKYLQLL